HSRHLRGDERLRLLDAAGPVEVRLVSIHGPDRDHSRDRRQHLYWIKRAAICDPGAMRHRLHRSYRLGPPPDQADLFSWRSWRRADQEGTDGSALALSQFHQSLLDAAAPRWPAALASGR